MGERELLGPKLVKDTNNVVQKIMMRMHTTHSIQKSYVDVRHRNLEFEVGDEIFLKVTLMKGVSMETS